MCIIIHKPAGIKLDRATYEECFRRNDDGAGIAYVDADQGLVVEKGFFKFKHLYRRLSQIEEGELLIHFRIQTHGGVSKANCHPFMHKSENFPQFSFAVAHNGQLPYASTATKSDTACFTEEVLFPHLDRDPWFLDQNTGRFFLESFMTLRNKMVVMRFDDKTDKITTYILNRKEGKADRGCWFSNMSWKPYVAPVYDYHEYSGFGSGRHHEQSEFGVGAGAQFGSAWASEWEKLKDMEKIRQGWFRDEKGNWRRLSDPRTDTQSMPDKKPIATPPVPPLPALPSTVANAIMDAHREAEKLEAERDSLGREVDGAVVEYIRKGTLTVNGEAVPDPSEKKITVPRDKAALVCSNLNHLTVEERKTMHRLCSDYITFLGLKAASGMSLMDMLGWVRDDMRDAREDLRDKTDIEIDTMLLQLQEEAIKSLKSDMLVASHA